MTKFWRNPMAVTHLLAIGHPLSRDEKGEFRKLLGEGMFVRDTDKSNLPVGMRPFTLRGLVK
jgi:hypothetical protein